METLIPDGPPALEMTMDALRELITKWTVESSLVTSIYHGHIFRKREEHFTKKNCVQDNIIHQVLGTHEHVCTGIMFVIVHVNVCSHVYLQYADVYFDMLSLSPGSESSLWVGYVFLTP